MSMFDIKQMNVISRILEKRERTFDGIMPTVRGVGHRE